LAAGCPDKVVGGVQQSQDAGAVRANKKIYLGEKQKIVGATGYFGVV
jgi:hypothetical protein